MDSKKLSPMTLAAVILSVMAAAAVIIAAITIIPKRFGERAEKPVEAVGGAESEVTTAEAKTTARESSAPETTTVSTTAATSAATVTTTAAEVTTVTTTASATTEPVTTTVTTTEAPATEAKPVTLGGAEKVVINEICAKNKKALADSDGDSSDWVELYNPTDSELSLEGAGLSDDPNEPFKWVFPSATIPPKSYLTVFCSDKDRSGKELHTNFKISEGETVALTAKGGETADSVTVPLCGEDETFGRIPDGSQTMKILEPSAGKSNDSSQSAEVRVAPPKMSAESGFYSSGFELSLTAEPDTVIYYTTNGSFPTIASEKYSSPIAISDRSNEKAVLTYKRGTTVDSSAEQFPREEFEKATVIRAIAVDSSGRKSAVSTATYFVGSKIAEKYKDVTVVSLVTDPDGLYNEKSGIYVAGDVFKDWRKANPNGELDGNTPANFNQRGREWEREAHVDFFRNGALEFAEDCGIRAHGGWSRNSQQKSFKFYMREEYGSSKLEYELFAGNKAYDSGKLIDEYKRFMIRNGGNDSFVMLFKDPWIQACASGLDVATQDSDLCICFLDGEYWGIYTLNEILDSHYIEENFGVNDNNAVMIKAGSLEEGEDGDIKLWDEARQFVEKNDMSKRENYEKACEYFDMESLCDYLALEIYIGNQDWIWGNWACWRAKETSDKPYEDGRWRFMVYDTEFSMDLYNGGRDYKFNIFSELAKGDGHLGPMLKSLLKSEDFKKMLVVAFEDVMNVSFNPSGAAAVMDTYYSKYSPFIGQHFRRWIFWQSENGIKENVKNFKQWLKNRYNYMPEQISSVMGLGSSAVNKLQISLDPSSGGYVKINGLQLKFTGGKWEGHYFPKYNITVEAVPRKGYEFAGWSGSVESSEAKITLDMRSATELTANFRKKAN